MVRMSASTISPREHVEALNRGSYRAALMEAHRPFVASESYMLLLEDSLLKLQQICDYNSINTQTSDEDLLDPRVDSAWTLCKKGCVLGVSNVFSLPPP